MAVSEGVHNGVRFNAFEAPKALILTVEDIPSSNVLYNSKVPEKAAFEARAPPAKEVLFTCLANRVEWEDRYDVEFYVEHLIRATESLFLPFGYTADRVRNALSGSEQATLVRFAMER